jgi:F0F1-type ATP synthase membrane subunit c/vacuolar-type H+-ATPase subunit K
MQELGAGVRRQLEMALRRARIVALALGATLPIYAAIAVAIQGRAAGAVPLEPLRLALLALSAVELAIAAWLGRRLARQGQAAPILTTGLQKLFTAVILRLALSESVALYGVVMVALGGDSLDLALFLGIAALGFLAFFPRWDAWEQWWRGRPEEG